MGKHETGQILGQNPLSCITLIILQEESQRSKKGGLDPD